MTLEIDLHGKTSDEAIYLLQRTIIQYPHCDRIDVIHGFNNGCVLKNLLRKKENIHSKRVLSTRPDPYNLGRTTIFLRIFK